jgi:putative membrane protein
MLQPAVRLAKTLGIIAVLGVGTVTGSALATGSHHQASGHATPAQAMDGKHRARDTTDDQRVSAWDEQWLMMSIEGDRFEIAGGKLAQSKGSTEIVRELGARLVRDHSKSLEEAVALAKRLGIDVPDSPSPTQQWELRVVATFSGREFDRWYSDLEVQDHIQDIMEAQDEVKQGTNEEVRHLAAEEIPVLQQHLELARAALNAVS